jgi:hypothetical protein
VKRSVAAVVIVLVGALAATSGASLPPRSETTRFVVSVKGKQVTHWVVDHHASGFCDENAQGSGQEKWRFSSSRRRMTFGSYGQGIFISPSSLNTHGKVTRYGKLTFSGGMDCGGGCGGPNCVTPRPDCGPHHVSRVPLELSYSTTPRHGLMLSSGGSGRPRYFTFKNCVLAGGAGYPELAPSNAYNTSRIEFPSVSRSKLFDRSVRKIVLHANLYYRTYGASGLSQGYAGSTHLTYTITLRRLKK